MLCAKLKGEAAGLALFQQCYVVRNVGTWSEEQLDKFGNFFCEQRHFDIDSMMQKFEE
jgi:hypothetical protein